MGKVVRVARISVGKSHYVGGLRELMDGQEFDADIDEKCVAYVLRKDVGYSGASINGVWSFFPSCYKEVKDD